MQGQAISPVSAPGSKWAQKWCATMPARQWGSSRWVDAAAILVLTFALRAATFGDPALHVDEEFYFYVGQQMLHGQLPYVDIWDRKPFGLFLLYAGFASISSSVLSYQIGASLCVAATAIVLHAIVRPFTGRAAALLTATSYVALLPTLGGLGGQAPVFYSLLIALAFLLLQQSLPQLWRGRVPLQVYAMIALGGLAVTIKQTSLFEPAAFGLYALVLASRGGMPATRAVAILGSFAAIGVAPFAATAWFYFQAGHWEAFYAAMVTSNLDKGTLPTANIVKNIGVIAISLALPLVLAGWGWLTSPKSDLRAMLLVWSGASLLGVAIIPNFYWHYAMPLLLPLCCMIGLAIEHASTRAVLLVLFAMLGGALYRAQVMNFEIHRESAANLETLAAAIDRENPRGTLLVFDGPPALYARTRAKPLSRVQFPGHLAEVIEDGATGTPQIEELRRILRQRPGAVTFSDQWDNWYARPGSRHSRAARNLVREYVTQHCHRATTLPMYENLWPMEYSVFTRCK